MKSPSQHPASIDTADADPRASAAFRVRPTSRRGVVRILGAGLASSGLRLLAAGGGAMATLVAAGCDRGPGADGAPAGQSGNSAGTGSAQTDGRRASRVAFKATDVTGAEYGKKLALEDAQGKARTLEEFRGKVVLVFFGFTQCPDVCPTTLAKAADVKKKLGDDGDRLQVLFVTLDPERDSAEVLGQYVTAFDPSFVALRGDAAQTQATAREFRVFYQKVPNRDGSSYTIDHTAASYVIDPKGQLRLFVRHAQETDDIASDIRQLLG